MLPAHLGVNTASLVLDLPVCAMNEWLGPENWKAFASCIRPQFPLSFMPLFILLAKLLALDNLLCGDEKKRAVFLSKSYCSGGFLHLYKPHNLYELVRLSSTGALTFYFYDFLKS